MNRASAMRVWLAGIAAVLLAACASSPVPEDHFYRLEPVVADQAFTQPPIDGVLKVLRVDAFGIYRERAILVSNAATPQQVSRHHYHYWIDTPPDLIRDHFVHYLRSAGVAELVAGDHVTQSSQVQLQLVLQNFTRVLDRNGGITVHVAVDLVATRSGAATPVLLASYSAVVPAIDGTMPASVDAFRAALAQLYPRITAELVAAAHR